MEKTGVLAIDTGNEFTGFSVLDADYKPIHFGKVKNEDLIEWIAMHLKELPKNACLEMIGSYGMIVGQTVFDTCVWIGRFAQFLDERGFKVTFVKRKEYVVYLMGTPRVKDANVIQYLIDRFAPNTPNRGKGHKDNKGWFYGFKADIWQSYAVGVWWLDIEREGKK